LNKECDFIEYSEPDKTTSKKVIPEKHSQGVGDKQNQTNIG